MFCPKCGVEARREASFCRSCGESLNGETKINNKVSPETRLVHANASPLKRFFNYIIDTIAIYIIDFVLVIALVLLDSSFADSEDFVFTLLAIAVTVLYYSLSEYWWGKTLGKFITKTRVLLNESIEIDYWTALKRTLIRYIPFEQFSIGNSLGTMWHDRWTNTRVADEKKLVRAEEIKSIPTIKKPWGFRLIRQIALVSMLIILVSGILAFLLGAPGTALLNIVLGFMGILGFMWVMIGLPLGLIDLAMRGGNRNYNGESNAAVLLGGIAILGIVFSSYALVFIIQALFGISLVTTNIT